MILIDGYKPKFSSFPNGERNLNFNTIRCNSSSIITFKYETDQDLMDLYILKSYLDEIMFGNSISLKILYMPYSRMDRRNDFYTFNLKYICNFINSLNFYCVELIDSHSDVTPALLDRSTNRSIIPSLYVAYTKMFNNTEHIIVYPDTTAEKRYSKFFQGIKSVVASKDRSFEDGKISKYIIDTTDMEGKNVVLIDDLCSRGGTFIAAANEIRKANVNRIDLIVAHCEENVMNGDIPHAPEGESIDRIFTTNSIITREWLNKNYNSVYGWLIKEKFTFIDLYEEKKNYE